MKGLFRPKKRHPHLKKNSSDFYNDNMIAGMIVKLIMDKYFNYCIFLDLCLRSTNIFEDGIIRFLPEEEL